MHGLIQELKDNNQDFEFYPTSKEMIKPIYESLKYHRVNNILDIGCGTCNFKKWVKEFEKEDIEAREREFCLYEDNYFVIEKSKILLEKLDKDTIVLGTDFHGTTLIDKKVSCIFCNPPYSEYEHWTNRIIWEGNCEYIYLVIPERWKENQKILKTIEQTKSNYEILGSFDFLNAERQARAKVDIVCITKPYSRYSEDNPAFDAWFDETFKMRDNIERSDYYTEKEKQESVRKKLLVAGNNKAECLVNLYQEEQKDLYKHFTAISELDADTLESIGIYKEAVKKSLQEKIKNLKILYWKIVFENLEQITDRLTWDSRNKLLNKFTGCNQVDFTFDNIYALIIWVIKNANGYYNDQIVTLYKELSHIENVKPYKSNQKVFEHEQWRFKNDRYYRKSDFQESGVHYTLDYRVIYKTYNLVKEYSTGSTELEERNVRRKIGDFCTIANNLGFEVGLIGIPSMFGEKETVLLKNGKTLFEYRIYKNRNMHINFNMEFAKALNVEVSRLLGWIRCKEDIAKEFTPEMAEGAEKYFKANKQVLLDNGLKLIGTVQSLEGGV